MLSSSCLSVCLHGSRLPLDAFSWNSTLEYTSDIRREKSSSIKNLTRILGTLHEDLRTFTIILGTLYEDLCTFTIISHRILLKMRNFSEKPCRENQNTHFIFHNIFPESRAVYNIMWKNLVEPDRLKTTIQYDAEKIACRITKARVWTHTHNI